MSLLQLTAKNVALHDLTNIQELLPEAFVKVHKMTQASLDKQLPSFLQSKHDLLTQLQSLPLSAKVCQLIRDIQNPPYQDTVLKKMYLEVKTQEWLVHLLAELKQSKTKNLPHQTLSLADRVRIFELEAYLLANLSHPPSLSVLAAKMKLHEKKLNQHFKQVFGLTIFAWHREQRLQTALDLLKKNEQTIQQIAHDCGYKYQADFSKAFKQRFGVTPKAMLVHRSQHVRIIET